MEQRYNQFYIDKADGSKRLISSPTPKLKQLSYKWLLELNDKLTGVQFFNVYAPHLHSYITGRGCSTLVNEITEYISDTKHYDIIYMDVVDYFGSITFSDWSQTILILNSIFGERLLPLEDIKNIWLCAVQEERAYQGLAQGNPLSPLISNLVGWCFIDKPLKRSLLDTGIQGLQCRYWRYSDNIFLVAKRDLAYSRERLLEYIYAEITNHIHPCYKFKVKVGFSNQTNIALGIRIGTRAQLKDKKWLRSVFHRYALRGNDMATHQDIIKEYGRLSGESVRQLVKGLAAYAMDIDPTMMPYIQKKLGGGDVTKRH